MIDWLLSGLTALGLLGLGGWLVRFALTGADDAMTGAPSPYHRVTRPLGIDDQPLVMRVLWGLAGAVSLLLGLGFAVATLLVVD
ncbi:MAG: hypothetical protein ABEJ74_03355 [Haloferacaceae archaeon]